MFIHLSGLVSINGLKPCRIVKLIVNKKSKLKKHSCRRRWRNSHFVNFDEIHILYISSFKVLRFSENRVSCYGNDTNGISGNSSSTWFLLTSVCVITYAKTRLGKLPTRVKRILLKLRFAIRQKGNAEVWLVILNHF